MRMSLICADVRIYTEYMENLSALSQGDTLFGVISEEQGYKQYVEDTQIFRNEKFISDNRKMGSPWKFILTTFRDPPYSVNGIGWKLFLKTLRGASGAKLGYPSSNNWFF